MLISWFDCTGMFLLNDTALKHEYFEIHQIFICEAKMIQFGAQVFPESFMYSIRQSVTIYDSTIGTWYVMCVEN